MTVKQRCSFRVEINTAGKADLQVELFVEGEKQCVGMKKKDDEIYIC